MSDNVCIEGIWEGSHFLFIEIDICTTYDDHETIETQLFVVYVQRVVVYVQCVVVATS